MISCFSSNLKNPHEGFDIKNFISFVSGDTCLAANWKLKHTRSTDNLAKNFYFNGFLRLWNALPVINTMYLSPCCD